MEVIHNSDDFRFFVEITIGIINGLLMFIIKDLWKRVRELEDNRAKDAIENARESLKRTDFQAFRTELLDTMHRFETNIAERVHGLEQRERERESSRKH